MCQPVILLKGVAGLMWRLSRSGLKPSIRGIYGSLGVCFENVPFGPLRDRSRSGQKLSRSGGQIKTRGVRNTLHA